VAMKAWFSVHSVCNPEKNPQPGEQPADSRYNSWAGGQTTPIHHWEFPSSGHTDSLLDTLGKWATLSVKPVAVFAVPPDEKQVVAAVAMDGNRLIVGTSTCQ
jgi:hypothetical protein